MCPAGRVPITAALIVRDEASHLSGCLATVATAVDEIVVVDTGSIDDSADVARRFGARVLDHSWTNDFSAARNRGLEAARGEWILYIDADERLRAPDRDALDRLLADRSLVALTVRFRPHTGFTRYREYRLFRNDSRIRFHGRIHETALADIFDVAGADGTRVAAADVEIDHLGYEGDLARKHARNLPLLRARLEDTPDHVYSWDHLGRTLLALGEPDQARDAWRTGIDIVRRRQGVEPLDALPYADLLREMSPGDDGFAELMAEAVALFPDDLMLQWLAGRTLMSAGRFAEARPVFERLAAIDPDTFCHGRVAYDRRIFRAFAYDSLGVIHFRLGQPAESARFFALAAAEDPAEPAHRVRRQLVEERARKALDAHR